MTAVRFICDADIVVEASPWGPYEWIPRPGITEADQLLLVRVRMPAGKARAFCRRLAMEEIMYMATESAVEVQTRKSKSISIPAASITSATKTT